MSKISDLYKKIKETSKRIDILTDECKHQDEVFNDIGNEFLKEYTEYACQMKLKTHEEQLKQEDIDTVNVEKLYSQIGKYKNEIDTIVQQYEASYAVSHGLKLDIQKFEFDDSEDEIIDNSDILENLMTENLKLHHAIASLKPAYAISTSSAQSANPLSPWN